MNVFDVVIVQPIFNVLMAVYGLIPDFGVSIIIFTILIRLLLWPLVKKQLHQAKAMRKMQPELAKLNATYKKNPQARNMAMLELYKKHNINPFSSIGVLLIQLPIIIGMYRVVQLFLAGPRELATYTYDFVEQLPTVSALIGGSSQLNQNFLGFMDLTSRAVSGGTAVFGLVLLALAAAVLQYLTSKQLSPNSDSKKRLRDVLAEASQGKETEQSEVNAIMMRKMMKFMPIMLFFIMISLPGALALYLATSNAVAYMQNQLILKKDETMMQALSTENVPSVAKQPPANTSGGARITRIKAKG